MGPQMYDDFRNGRFEQGTESLMNVALIVDGGVALTKLGVGVVRDWKALQAEKVAFERTVSEGEVANNFYRDGSEYTFTSSNEINALHEAKGSLAPYMPDTPVVQGFAPKGTTETQVVSALQVVKISDGTNAVGGWSTTDLVPHQGYARDTLAIIPDFKSDVGYTVTIETIQETPFNRGIVGPQVGAEGGGMQTEWLVSWAERGSYITPVPGTVKPLVPVADAAEGLHFEVRSLKLRVTDSKLSGTGTLGYTQPNGDVFLQPGLSRTEQVVTLRHEGVHSFLSVKDGAPLANARQNFGMWGYNNSTLLRWGEEGLAQGIATRSVTEGLKFAIVNPYGVSVPQLAFEGLLAGGGAGGIWYGSYLLGKGD